MSDKPGVQLKLSVMMFLQYAIWGAWGVSIGGYMDATLYFTGSQIGAIFSTTAIGAMISPLFIGYVADRLLATEKMIGILHLLGAVLLGVAAFTTDFPTLYGVMVVYAVCYMPTLALTNSISFANIDDPEKEFPRIRVWGTLGWIAVGLLVGFVLGGTTNLPILLAAGLSLALALFSFALPHTPPQGRRDAPTETTQDAKGSGILELLQDSSFLVFVIASFLVCIPLSFYYGFANVFLAELNAPYPTALQTIGQMSEVGFMAAMPFFILRLGVKKMLAVGMLAWVIRYLCFGTLQLPLIVFGLFLHGICYDFFFVASQIYVDTQVVERQRASAQSFIAFVTMGVGMFVGANVAGWTVDRYPSPYAVQATITESDGSQDSKKLPLPSWESASVHLSADGDRGVPVDLATGTYSETNDKTNSTTEYTHSDLAAALKLADKDGDLHVTETEWNAARSDPHQWFQIWLWPALAALGTCILFWIGFKEPSEKDSQLLEKMAEEAPLGAGEGPEPQVG